MQSSKTHQAGVAAKAAEFVRDGVGGRRQARTDAAKPGPDEIAKAAYYRAQARDFRPGSELEDWLAAERELNTTQGRSRRR